MTRIDLAAIEPAYRLLLTTDGTLTNMLAAMYLEEIRLFPLTQRLYRTQGYVESLALEPGKSVLERKVVLKGETTGKTYVYAEALLALERLDLRTREALLTSDTPIGRLWKANRIETFKEILHFGMQSAGARAVYFGIDPEMPMLIRNSRVSSGGQPVAVITEHLRYERAEQINSRPYPSCLASEAEQVQSIRA